MDEDQCSTLRCHGITWRHKVTLWQRRSTTTHSHKIQSWLTARWTSCSCSMNLASISDGDLAGMIDTNNVGVIGYSLGAGLSCRCWV